MLKKLIKYDLKWMFKILNIYYIISILSAILTRCFSSSNIPIMIIIYKILSGITITLMINVIINTIIRCWVRFKNNFYKDESYLTHTLPIQKNKLFQSKIISTIITIFLSIIVILITFLIAYYSKDLINEFKTIIINASSLLNGSMLEIILLISFLLFFEFTFIVLVGYFGILIGERKNNKKVFYTIFSGIVFYMLSSVIMLGLVYLIGLFNSDILVLFKTDKIFSLSIFRLLLYICSLIYLIFIIITYFIENKIFNKGVNID